MICYEYFIHMLTTYLCTHSSSVVSVVRIDVSFWNFRGLYSDTFFFSSRRMREAGRSTCQIVDPLPSVRPGRSGQATEHNTLLSIKLELAPKTHRASVIRKYACYCERVALRIEPHRDKGRPTGISGRAPRCTRAAHIARGCPHSSRTHGNSLRRDGCAARRLLAANMGACIPVSRRRKLSGSRAVGERVREWNGSEP